MQRLLANPKPYEVWLAVAIPWSSETGFRPVEPSYHTHPSSPHKIFSPSLAHTKCSARLQNAKLRCGGLLCHEGPARHSILRPVRNEYDPTTFLAQLNRYSVLLLNRYSVLLTQSKQTSMQRRAACGSAMKGQASKQASKMEKQAV